MHGNPEFLELLSALDVAAMAAQGNIVLGLWPDLRIGCYNEAWLRFAKQNLGEPIISERYGLGACVLDGMTEPSRDFYRQRFEECLKLHKTWEHRYQCSSPELFREFHMSILPLRNQSGLLAVHCLVVETPGEQIAHSPDADVYFNQDGFVRQCSHCRRVQNLAHANRWDWVPQWVQRPAAFISHGLCPPCYNYYYRECDHQFPQPLRADLDG